MAKLDVIKSFMVMYFEQEDKDDLFEGFLRLIIKLDKYSSSMTKQHDLSLVKIAMVAYHDFSVGHPESVESIKQPEDPKLIVCLYVLNN